MKREKKQVNTRSTPIAKLGRRTPFRPFALRLSNGEAYVFNTPESFGATSDLRLIVCFEEHQCTSIDANSVTEIIEDTTPKHSNGE